MVSQRGDYNIIREIYISVCKIRLDLIKRQSLRC